jgi:hypothetical protein
MFRGTREKAREISDFRFEISELRKGDGETNSNSNANPSPFTRAQVGHIFVGVSRAGEASRRPYEGKCNDSGKCNGDSHGNDNDKCRSLTLKNGFGMTARKVTAGIENNYARY